MMNTILESRSPSIPEGFGGARRRSEAAGELLGNNQEMDQKSYPDGFKMNTCEIPNVFITKQCFNNGTF